MRPNQEEINKERDRIKTSNYQVLLNILNAQGIDGTKMSRHEFDRLLRLMKEDSELQQAHKIPELDKAIKEGINMIELQAGAKVQAEEHAGSNPAHPFISSSVLNPNHKEIRGMMKLPQAQVKDGKIMCKCGHWIDIVGTKWQHMAVILTDSCGGDTPTTSEIRSRESCYYCDCAEPTPLEERGQ